VLKERRERRDPRACPSSLLVVPTILARIRDVLGRGCGQTTDLGGPNRRLSSPFAVIHLRGHGLASCFATITIVMGLNRNLAAVPQEKQAAARRQKQ
jgi:hypothetical protein